MNIRTFPLLALAVAVVACSSDKPAPAAPKFLGTTSKSQTYFYCESCPAPTKLTKGAYKPLEPDEPITEVKPVVEVKPVTITNNKRSKHKARKKIKHHKNQVVRKRPNLQRQCIQWSN